MESHHAYVSRLNTLWYVIAAGGVALGLRAFQLQVLEGGIYALAAERNRTQMIYQTAPRGRIYDRKGAALATNQPAFSLIYMPGKSKDMAPLEALAQDLAVQLKREPAQVLETLQHAVREETAIRLAENLPARTMFRLSEIKTIYPGVDLIVEARRYYPYGRLASHLIGYVGKMGPRSWKELKSKGYRVDARIGRIGLESVFERELKGKDGGLQMEVDAQGRLKRVLTQIPWKAGSNVHLTLDADVQRAAEEGLRKSITGRGAVVALDPRSGAILALASAPDFDPNSLLDPEQASEAFATLPEFNAAISGTYPPGSIFKPVVGAAMMESGRVGLHETVFCPGFFELGKKIFLCWEHKGHKTVSWLAALTNSCDVYFWKMGLKTGGPLIEQTAKMFGLGARTNIALKGEKRGNLFGPTLRASAGKPWYDGDTINLAIGQGELLVTPMQMAVMTAAIASRGTVWRPHYTQRIVYADGRPDYRQKPEPLSTVSLKPQTWDGLDAALRMVVSSGTGARANIPGLIVAGKTGTAQNPGKDHAWFISYASRPGEAPGIAVAVIVENGEHGSSAAAPIAKEVMLAAYGMQAPAPAPTPARPPAPLPGGPPIERTPTPAVRSL